MIKITHYLDDGANWQAQAVLAMLRAYHEDIINESWDSTNKEYQARIKVGRYENSREQGYVFTLEYNYRQVKHYAVYEHRNSDDLVVVVFNGTYLNTPRESALDMKDKYDYTKVFNRQIIECGEWIIADMQKEIKKINDGLKHFFYTAKGTRVQVSYCDDVGENHGGYFCQIHLDGWEDDSIDTFVIHAEDMQGFDSNSIAWRIFTLTDKYISSITEY